MAQTTVRANLSNVQIPLLTEEFGPSVVVRQQDMNYVPTVSSKADLDKDVGIPQLYYAHNVMPTNYGYRSVSYSAQIPAWPHATAEFIDVWPLLSPTGAKVFLGRSRLQRGDFYCDISSGYAWQYNGLSCALTITPDSSPANTGTGTVVSARNLGAPVSTNYVIAFTSAAAFTVTKNGTPLAAGTVGTEYVDAGNIMFTINAGTVAFTAGDGFTITVAAADPNFGEATVTSATISGRTLFCLAGVGIFEYNFTNHVLEWVQATGLEASELMGITSCNGYLIAYSEETVAWSSTIDILDFVPSLSTGAGSGSVEDAKGPIRRCVGLTSGFLVFTAANCVAAVFTQNIRYPFVFREVPGAGGIPDLSQVTDEADSTSVYAFTSYGLQQISTQKATLVLPELSDFLTGKRFEDFDSNLLTFTTQNLTSPLKKKVEFVSGRFLVVSYGVSSYTHAIIYDTALQRFGKLKRAHTGTFQYGFLDADDADTAKKQIALLAADGSVNTVEFAAGVSAADSVAMVGKFQLVRSKFVQLCAVDVETVDAGVDLELYDFCTRDGKSFEAPVAGYMVSDQHSVRTYRFRITGQNHSLLLKGTFRLNAFVITVAATGG